MKEKLIPTNKTFSVGVDLKLPKLNKIKEYLHKNYNNKYNFPAHIGITLIPINNKCASDAILHCKNYFTNHKPIKVKLSKIIYEPNSLNPDETMITIKVISKELKQIHKDLLISLNKNYRDRRIRQKDYQRIKQGILTGGKLQNVINYGFAYVLKLYNPHLTIGSIPTKFVTKELKQKISNQLKGIENSTIYLKNIHILYHTNPKVQTQSKVIKGVNILLK